jgi:hypothetical protein
MTPKSTLSKGLLLGTCLLAACGSPSAAINKPADYSPTGQTKCKVLKSSERPLIVEWPASDRSDLETLLGRGLVPIRYTGCEVELLRNCSATGRYAYQGTTRETERETMRSADELYAKMPIGAVKFESMIERGSQLTVAMTVVGKYLADRTAVGEGDLQGEGCARATHVITGLTAGAFEFFSESGASVGGNVMGVVGGKSSDQRELLRQAGDPKACEAGTRSDTNPPNNCGALLRMEVSRVQCAEGKTFSETEGCVAAKTAGPGPAETVRSSVRTKPNYAPMATYLGEIGKALVVTAQGKPPPAKWNCATRSGDLRQTTPEALKKFTQMGNAAKWVGTGFALRLEAALPASYASQASSSSTAEPPKVELEPVMMVGADGKFRVVVEGHVRSGKVEASGGTQWVEFAPDPFRKAVEQLLGDLKQCSAPLVTVEDLIALPVPERAKAEGMKELGKVAEESQKACRLVADAVGKWTIEIDRMKVFSIAVAGPMLAGMTSRLRDGGQPFCLESMQVEFMDNK